MVDKSALREQFVEAFEGADYPVSSPMELVPALPNGPATSFEAGDFSMSAMELQSNLGDAADFPYESVDDFVDDVMEALESQDHI
jgi:hypothetical protein